MASFRTEAIILRRRDYRETDRIVTFFSKDFGKITGIAFGAKKSTKRFSNCLEPFVLSRIFFSQRPNRDLIRLESCEMLSGRKRLAEDVNRLAHASYLAELATLLTADRDRNEDLFLLLAACMDLIEDGKRPEDVTRIFEVRFLTLLGYRLNLTVCGACQAPLLEQGKSYFQTSEGSLQCEKCAKDRSLAVSEGTLKTLAFAQDQPLEKAGRLRISRGAEREARKALESFLVHLMQKRPKSLDFIRRIREEKK